MTEYLRFLRSHVGHAPLLQCGAGVILLDGEGRILLQLREETGLMAGSLELFGVFSGPELHYVYPNGDEVHNIDIVFLCRDWSGTLRPQPGEVLELAFSRRSVFPRLCRRPVSRRCAAVFSIWGIRA